MTESEEREAAEGLVEVEGVDCPKVVEWEELQEELARLWSLSSALRKAKEKKDSLLFRLHSLIQVKEESLGQSNELEEMRQKVDEKKQVMENILTRTNSKLEDVRNQKKNLASAIRVLLFSAKTLSAACGQLQEAKRLLAGERGYCHLRNLQKMLRVRQQCMITQVSALYPVKTSSETAREEKIVSCPNANRNSEDEVGSQSSGMSRTGNAGTSTLTISGLQLNVFPLKKMSFFSDKKEIQKSATALGYVAHAISLIASHLDVPLRYPLHLGGSRTFIFDYAPSVEPNLLDSVSNPSTSLNIKPTEFPLFLEGQDTTRAAYAIFLLNKDLEQLLNLIGVESLGPRHVLANLKELFKSVQSQKFVDN